MLAVVFGDVVMFEVSAQKCLFFLKMQIKTIIVCLGLQEWAGSVWCVCVCKNVTVVWCNFTHISPSYTDRVNMCESTYLIFLRESYFCGKCVLPIVYHL